MIEGRKKERKKEIMIFGIGGQRFEISRDDILIATQGVSPKPFDGRNKFFVEIHGNMYPIKQPIHLVTGLPYTGGFTAQYASHILRKLGFTIHTLEETDTIKPRPLKVKTTALEDTKRFAITLEQDEDGFIVTSCPALPGCHSQGKTEEEAITNIREAIRGYIASLRQHGEPIPNITEIREVEVAV
jgi:antitoxin HicB